MTLHSSAALTEAERTIKQLSEENSLLKKELQETKSLYAQLVQESEHESFDERRVLLLKSQVIQLERQILLLTEALSSRADVQLDIEIALLDIADWCRKYICIDNKNSHLSVPRAEFMKHVELAESVRLKLAKAIENNSSEKLAKPLLLMNGFVKQEEGSDLTLMDICMGKFDHLNLKEVGKLENNLIELYQCLSTVEQSLAKSLVKPQNHDVKCHTPHAEMQRQYINVQNAIGKLQICSEQLLQLSVLIPAAPLPAFKSKIKDVTTERVVDSLPVSVKSKPETKQVIDGLLKSVNYLIHMKTMEIKALKDELLFHQKVYQQQCQYMDNLFQAMKVGYGQFESNAIEYLINPLDDIFEKYDLLKADASENALKDFLTTFKSHADRVQSTLDKMKPDPDCDRAEALSEFGEEFFADLSLLQNECAKKRDEFVSQLDIVERMREDHAYELESLLKPVKPQKNQAKIDYERIIAGDQDCDDSFDSPIIKGTFKPTVKTFPSKLSVYERNPSCTGCLESPETNGKKTAVKERSKPKVANRNTPPSDPKLPRTPISGSSIPRTPSSTPARRMSEPKRLGTSSTGSTPSGVPLRNLKLKK